MNEIVKAIDKAVQAREAAKPARTHLGASAIGGKCIRAIWYGFRLAYREQHGGRLLRLFGRGHREEDRFNEFLRMAGATVRAHSQRLCHSSGTYLCVDWEADIPEGYTDVSSSAEHIALAEAQGCGPRQWRFEDHNGHFAGSTDGIVSGLEEFDLVGWGLLEFKTHSEKSFKDISTKGVLTSKPEHYAQMQVYMHYMKLPWALYMAVNKNNDELYTEVIFYREEFALQMIARAAGIIETSVSPKRLSDDPSWFACKYCAFREICHYQASPQKNCRSCVYASAVEDGKWFCGMHNGDIPKDFIETACGSWEGVR